MCREEEEEDAQMDRPPPFQPLTTVIWVTIEIIIELLRIIMYYFFYLSRGSHIVGPVTLTRDTKSLAME